MMDNPHQPIRGNWIIHEDGDAQGEQLIPITTTCGPVSTSGDADNQSTAVLDRDLNDLNAEWTGGL
jgi:hypothetical protein